MCLHGIYKQVSVINPNQGKRNVVIDACIADEIKVLNDNGIVTLSCCCGHGKAGQITEWENDFGKWKEFLQPPHTLIIEESVSLAKKLGYSPYPYYYADGAMNKVWQMQLKSGCVTEEECKHWHILYNLPFIEDIGVIK